MSYQNLEALLKKKKKRFRFQNVYGVVESSGLGIWAKF